MRVGWAQGGVFWSAFLVALLPGLYAQAGSPQVSTTTIAGILIVSDYRCNELRAKHQVSYEAEPWYCPGGSSQWALLSGSKKYVVLGSLAELRRFERSRVLLTGVISSNTILVSSIAHSALEESEVRALIEKMRGTRLSPPQNISNPTYWKFNWDETMLRILQAGPAAQNVLLDYLAEYDIQDQVILLLGGVGDENVIQPIIEAMPVPEDRSDEARRTNLVANLALTNITQAEVIWHHGGGLTIEHCPDNPKSCWSAWWAQNRATFKVATEKENRNYSNYPNYGIYQQP